MAYLDLHNVFAAPVASAGRMPAPARLSALEWSVVALARGDTLASLAQPGRIARAMGAVFGTRGKSPLADPRLEALRRVAVHAWRRGFAVPVREIDRFLAAGFDAAQLELLVTSIVAGRMPAA